MDTSRKNYDRSHQEALGGCIVQVRVECRPKAQHFRTLLPELMHQECFRCGLLLYCCGGSFKLLLVTRTHTVAG
jgi:hypothetical protein